MLLPETKFPVSDVREEDAELARQIWGRPVPDPTAVEQFLSFGSQTILPHTYGMQLYVSSIGKNLLPALDAADKAGLEAMRSGMQLYASMYAIQHGPQPLPLHDTAIFTVISTDTDVFVDQAQESLSDKEALKELIGRMTFGLLLAKRYVRVAEVGSGAIHLAVLASQQMERNALEMEQIEIPSDTAGLSMDVLESAPELQELQVMFRDLGMAD